MRFRLAGVKEKEDDEEEAANESELLWSDMQVLEEEKKGKASMRVYVRVKMRVNI